MSVDCGACFVKYVLCLFNFVFFIAGSIVLGIGIWIAADRSSFIQATKIIESTEVIKGDARRRARACCDLGDRTIAEVKQHGRDVVLGWVTIQLSQFTEPNVVAQVAYVLIAAGTFVFLISFLGYCGALKESRCLLKSYGIVLLIILVVEIAAGALVLGYRDKVEKKTREIFKGSIKDYYTTSENGDLVTLFWNQLMVKLECCGVDDYRDFDESPFRVKGNMTVPTACCVLVGDRNDPRRLQPKDPRCPYSPTESNSYYKTGCYPTFINLLLDNANIAIGIGIGLGLVQLLGIFFAFCLSKSIDRYFK